MANGLIDSVGITIHAKDGQIKEIALEEWQVGVICQMLGLSVHLPDLNDYEMSSKNIVDERMALYYSAIKNLHSKNEDS